MSVGKVIWNCTSGKGVHFNRLPLPRAEVSCTVFRVPELNLLFLHTVGFSFFYSAITNLLPWGKKNSKWRRDACFMKTASAFLMWMLPFQCTCP